MAICDWTECGKEHSNERQEIHIRPYGDTTFYACSPTCEHDIIEDIYDQIRASQAAQSKSKGMVSGVCFDLISTFPKEINADKDENEGIV
jgi:hypothetical protein